MLRMLVWVDSVIPDKVILVATLWELWIHAQEELSASKTPYKVVKEWTLKTICQEMMWSYNKRLILSQIVWSCSRRIGFFPSKIRHMSLRSPPTLKLTIYTSLLLILRHPNLYLSTYLLKKHRKLLHNSKTTTRWWLTVYKLCKSAWSSLTPNLFSNSSKKE